MRDPRRAVRWAILIWLGVTAVVWNGFFDLLISRGEKQYFLEQARYELRLGPEPSLDAIMKRTRGDAVRVASLWGLFVFASGVATTVLLARDPPKGAR